MLLKLQFLPFFWKKKTKQTQNNIPIRIFTWLIQINIPLISVYLTYIDVP